MRTLILGCALVAVVSVAGCGPADGTLKGRVVNGSEPVVPNGQLVSLSFHPIGPDGEAAKDCYTAALQGDGSFEFVASGGRLPPGKYRVVIAGVQVGPAAGKAQPKPDRFAGFSTLKQSKLEITVDRGANDVVVDVAKASR